MNAEQRRKTVSYILDHDVMAKIVGRRVVRKALYKYQDETLKAVKRGILTMKKEFRKKQRKKRI